MKIYLFSYLAISANSQTPRETLLKKKVENLMLFLICMICSMDFIRSLDLRRNLNKWNYNFYDGRTAVIKYHLSHMQKYSFYLDFLHVALYILLLKKKINLIILYLVFQNNIKSNRCF